jgi:hypothetical protein
MPNAFGEGEMTLWFHPRCAAFKRPESVLQALSEATDDIPDREGLERVARGAMAHRRLQRVDGAERSPSGQAKCRCCRNPIERASWRIRLVFYEEGRFSPGGFIHLACHPVYFEGHDALEPTLHFSSALDEAGRDEFRRAYREVPADRPPSEAPPDAPASTT